MTILWFAVGAVVVFALALFISYNRFVSQRNLVDNSWHNIDTELRRRYDLIPNLVEAVRGYASHEREVFESVTQARTTAMAATGPASAQEGPERVLVDGLKRLFAVAESYPDLQASESFLALQRELIDTEDRIQVARRIYNANVRSLNTRVQAFPSNLVARGFGFHESAYFEVEESMHSAQPPPVSV